MVKIGGNIQGLEKSLNDAQSRLKSAGKTMSTVGRTATIGMTLPIVGMGVAVVKAAADFEQSMANAASVSGATGEELKQMTDLAREMGKTTVFSAQDAGDAMYYMSSAGYKAGQMAEAIQPTLDLAAATQSDLAFTTDTTIATLNQFGLAAKDTGRVTNTFAAVIGNSQATLDKLAYSMRYVGPVANSLGYSVESTTAALGLLYDAGFKGEQAGTVLRGALSQLLSPSKAVDRTLSQLGLNYAQVNPATNSLADIIGILGESSITTAQAVEIFGQEAGPGMMALIAQGADALVEMEEKITGTSAATEMAKKQLDTFKGQLKLLKSAASEVSIQLGNILIPILTALVTTYLMPAVNAFSALDTETQKYILAIAGLAAAIGPLLWILGGMASGISALITLFAPLVAWIGTIVSALGLWIGGASTFAEAMLLIMGPVGWVIAAVIALGVALIVLWNKSETFKNGVLAVWDAIYTWAVTHWPAIRDTIISVFQAIWAYIQPVVSAIGSFLHEVFGEIFTWWKENWGLVSQVITLYYSTIWKTIKLYSGIIWDLLKPWLNLLWNQFKIIWTGIEFVVKTAWEILKLIVRNAIDIIGGIIKAAMQLITGDWQGAWNTMKETGEKVLGNISVFIHNTLDNIVAFIKKLKSRFYEMGADLFYGLRDGILNAGTRAINAAREVAARVASAVAGFFKIKSPSRVMMDMGGYFTEGFADGITGNIKTAMAAAKNLSAATMNTVTTSPAFTTAPQLFKPDVSTPVNNNNGYPQQPIIYNTIYLGNEKVFEGFDNQLGGRVVSLGGS